MRYLDPLRKLRVLYVDDAGAGQVELRDWLDALFADVLVAGTMAEALRLTEEVAVQALVSEIRLPDAGSGAGGGGVGGDPAVAVSGFAGDLRQCLHRAGGFADGHQGQPRRLPDQALGMVGLQGGFATAGGAAQPGERGDGVLGQRELLLPPGRQLDQRGPDPVPDPPGAAADRDPDRPPGAVGPYRADVAVTL